MPGSDYFHSASGEHSKETAGEPPPPQGDCNDTATTSVISLSMPLELSSVLVKAAVLIRTSSILVEAAVLVSDCKTCLLTASNQTS
ncbi:hypothetical protein SESBI_19655 [Sesbania bispinosa]|nr:hypothetical protein SESBI_19655 [Sesbania bispinosa]